MKTLESSKPALSFDRVPSVMGPAKYFYRDALARVTVRQIFLSGLWEAQHDIGGKIICQASNASQCMKLASDLI